MNIQTIIKKNLCLGCGVCLYDTSIRKMYRSDKKGLFLPKIEKKGANYTIASQICPAKGYNIVNDAKKLYPSTKKSVELEHYDKLFASHSTSDDILNNASSGGAMTEFLLYLLNKGIVDYGVVTKFEYTNRGPKTKTFLTNNKDEILNSQGSKYCPVDISNGIEEIKKISGKVAYLGTPCQISGIRKIQKIVPIRGF